MVQLHPDPPFVRPPGRREADAGFGAENKAQGARAAECTSVHEQRSATCNAVIGGEDKSGAIAQLGEH